MISGTMAFPLSFWAQQALNKPGADGVTHPGGFARVHLLAERRGLIRGPGQMMHAVCNISGEFIVRAGAQVPLVPGLVKIDHQFPGVTMHPGDGGIRKTDHVGYLISGKKCLVECLYFIVTDPEDGERGKRKAGGNGFNFRAQELAQFPYSGRIGAILCLPVGQGDFHWGRRCEGEAYCLRRR